MSEPIQRPIRKWVATMSLVALQFPLLGVAGAILIMVPSVSA